MAVLSALLVLSPLARAADAEEPEATLKVGDRAPKLQVSKWVQGEPVKALETGKAYLVEFWATWCGPCRTTIPHLNELHQKYKDKGLTVIGQNVWEKEQDRVVPFVKKMGDKMTYRVALDDVKDGERGAMAETWMTAAGQNGIPAAFLVNKEGRIAWIGHPMTLKERVIDQVLEGTFDIKKAAAERAAAAKNQKELQSLWGKAQKSIKAEKWDEAESSFGEMEKLLAEDERAPLDMARFRMNITKKDYPAAYKLARRISDSQPDNAMLQNQLAWMILTDKKIEERDLKLAETVATRANDAAKGKDAGILDTLARAKFMNGEKDKAIELQEKAIALAEGEMKDQFSDTLKSYREGKLPQE